MDQFWGTLVATLVVGLVYYKIQGPSGGILKVELNSLHLYYF